MESSSTSETGVPSPKEGKEKIKSPSKKDVPEKSKREDQPRNKIRPQIVAAIVVNLTLLSCGFCYAWADQCLTSDKGAWEVIAVPIGAILGAIIPGLLLNHIGRKWCLYVTSIPLLASWILLAIENSWVELFVARFIGGVSVGSIFTTVPVYLGELTETNIRGIAMAMMPLLFNLGYLVMNGIALLLNAKMMAWIGLIPSVLFLLSAPWVPESPYYDLRKKKTECAELSLTWLRRKTKNDEDLDEMRTFAQAEDDNDIRKLYTLPTHRNALLIVLLLIAGQQLSGLLVVRSYSTVLLRQMSLSVDILLVMSGISFVTSILSTSIVDLLGRKPIFLISSYGSSLCLLLLGAYIYVTNHGIVKLDNLRWIPLIPVAIYTFCFAFGLAPIPHIVSSELFPMSVKPLANAIAIVTGSVLAIIIAKIYQLMIDAADYDKTFFIFGAIQLVIAALASIFLRETRRMSFADVQEMLRGGAADK